jgi:hypothetical protein
MIDKITVSGNVEYAQYLTLKEQKYYILTKSVEDANTLNIRVKGKDFTLMRDGSLPIVNIGDEIEVTGLPNSHGWIEVTILNNHTIGVEWKSSRTSNDL